jgi:transposase
MKYFAGLDVSLAETAICIVDEDGIVAREGKAVSAPEDLVRWLAATGLTLARLGLEAGPLSPWLHTGLQAAGLPAICIETRRMKGATAAMAVKTDRNDARAIAHAMRVGWFTIVHVKSAESQELRFLLSNRRTLLEKRVAIDNEIRGTLKAFGLKVGAVGVAGFIARVIELLGDRPRLLPMVQPMLQAREALRQQSAALTKMVIEAVRASSVCRRLLSVPGVGPIVALTYATGIDDPARFAHSRDIGPHFGLTPRKYASGEIDRNGSITKAGDGAVREALVQAALTLLTRNRRWCALKAWGVAVAKRRGLHRAIVAVARKLAIILHRIWVDGTTFTWSHKAPATEAAAA